jgi:hypothetical protein
MRQVESQGDEKVTTIGAIGIPTIPSVAHKNEVIGDPGGKIDKRVAKLNRKQK